MLLGLVLFAKVADSSWEALRFSKVGPTDHLAELRSIRPQLGKERTLFLGNDDFYAWELAGARVTAAYSAGIPGVPSPPEKPFVFGQPVDFDSLTAATMNEFDWFITTRDAAGSEPPPQMHLVRTTANYELWRRVGEVAPRRTLAEGPNAAAVLNCSTAAGRAVVRAGGVAAVRAPSTGVAVPLIVPGGRATVTLGLSAGRWALETLYVSPLPIRVTGPGVSTTLPANLDRSGPRWPIGEIALQRATPVPLTLEVVKHLLTPVSDAAAPAAVIATRLSPDVVVPVRDACGKPVDWYRSA